MLKIVIFDFDGTIADSLAVSVECVNELARAEGKRCVNKDDLLQLRGMDTKRAICEKACIPKILFPIYAARVRRLMSSRLDSFKIYPGMKELIHVLSKHCAVGILTSNSASIVRSIMAKENLAGVSFVHSDSSLFGKAISLRYLMLRHHLKHENIIYVGDEIRDIIACRKAGVRCIAVTWGYNSRASLAKEKPYAIVDTPNELQARLFSLLA
jgi:phosphoglycolate phosphatase